jgi:HEPN domain-containing protein
VTENRANDWWRQAQNDLKFARSALREKFYSQCCFVCQQGAEKALKSALLKRGARAVFTHSLVKLCDLLKIDGKLKESAQTLDQYYVSGRYPDGLPAGAPFEMFNASHAKGALDAAKRIFAAAKEDRARGGK